MTSKQFYVMLIVIVISMKVQRLPCIIYGEVGKDGWITLLLYLAVNLIGILLAFYILKKTKNLSLEQRCKTGIGEFFKRLLLITVAFYFLMQALLLYESMQNLFEHTLFENLPWNLFSLLLLVCIFYLATTGLKKLALSFELYFVILILGYIILSVLGTTTTDFTEMLPFNTINMKEIASSFSKFNLWFGDFFLILFIGKGAKNIKLSWTVLTYSIAMLFVLFLNLVFVGIYLEYATIQSSLISMIAEQSMLGLNIGRVDWLLILIVEIGTILSCAVCFFLSGKCLHAVVPKIKFGYVLAFLAAILYVFDVAYLVDTHTRQLAILNIFSIVSIAIKLTVLVVLLILSMSIKINKNDANHKQEQPVVSDDKIKTKKRTKELLGSNKSSGIAKDMPQAQKRRRNKYETN